MCWIHNRKPWIPAKEGSNSLALDRILCKGMASGWQEGIQDSEEVWSKQVPIETL